ncbi:MAG: response regulator [Terrimicrobiaceae bacterium]
MKILAIDDNSDNLRVLEAVLLDRLPGAGLLTALNGPSGLGLAEAEDPEVILLDIVMPDMDGYEVCRKLKANVRLKSIPVLFLTAHTDRDSRIKAVEAGADGFLSKPFDEVELTVQILAMAKLKAANRLQRLEKEQLAALVAERTRALEQELAERKRAEIYREMGREILQILSEPEDFSACLRRVLSVLKTRTGVDALGIRLQDGEDFPYIVQEGFSRSFLRTENTLLGRTPDGRVCRDNTGAPCLECACGLVVSGKAAPASEIFTPGGSFWTNNSSALLDIPPDKDPRFHPRNLCVRCGYASVALVPIRTHEKIVGLIQLNDRRKDCFTIETVELLEGVGSHIGEALIRKRAEESSKVEQALTNTIIGSIPGAFYMLDKHGRFVRWNAYLRDELVGKPEDCVANSHAVDIVHPDDRALIGSKIAGVLESGVQATAEARVLVKGGPAYRWLVLTGRKMVVDGSPFLLGIGIDITDRKVMEEKLNEALLSAESAALAKSEFLAVMSHELRTPLNGILGFSELLACSPLDGEQSENLQTISDCGNHLLGLVNDILDFSSIERGALPLESAAVALGPLLDSSSLPIRKAASQKGLVFRCEVSVGVPEQITGDERRIRQILINLLGNAVKFTSCGSVVLRVAPAVSGGRTFLDFSVRDTGIGIRPDMLNFLFKPFTQADSTLRRQFDGAGLGLAISQRLAEAMKGAISVVSTPGEGSTFTFRLPVDTSPPPLADGGSPVSGKSGPHGNSRPSGGGLVLVVEDDSANSLLAGKMLGAIGYRAAFAANGQEAVDAFEPGKYSAILMDIRMPVMDGLAAAKRIREIEGRSGTHVPIIALTANVMPGDRERCLAAGMGEFLTKPFKKMDLAAALARLLPARQETA